MRPPPSHRRARGTSSRARGAPPDRLEMALDGLPVTALNRPGELEPVLDRPAHQRVESLGRRARRLEQRAGRMPERDEVVRGDRRARVVGGSVLVAQGERLAGRAASASPVPTACASSLSRRHGRPGAVELLRAPAARERLQRMDAEPPDVGVKGGQRRRAADVRDPRARCDARSHLGDGAVGDAEKDEVRRRSRVERDPALARAAPQPPSRPGRCRSH